MTKPTRPAKKSRPDIPYNPIPLRERHDGWTADRQTDFIDALAATGCVTDAARAVGLSVRSAYRLRANPGAGSFRLAWDNALEYAILRLEDAVTSRAIKGVPIPHYYQGKKVGEHRRYDDRLAQFLLRVRRPAFYGRFAEESEIALPSDLYAVALERAISRLQPGVAERHARRLDPNWLQNVTPHGMEPPPPPPNMSQAELKAYYKKDLEKFLAAEREKERILNAKAEERDRLQGSDWLDPNLPEGEPSGG